MDVIPAINGKFEIGNQKIKLPSPLTISEGFNLNTNIFRGRMLLIGVQVQASQSPFIKLLQSDALKNEEYVLKLSNNEIIAEFSDISGLNNALVTLFQLTMLNKLFCGIIHDFPKYHYRGIHLDTARHFFEVEELEKIIEQLSLLKINTIHWHFADDQAWRLEINEYPKLTENCGENFYTQAQAHRIVKFAFERGVQIIPEFEIPAHSTALISAYPTLSCRNAKVKPPNDGGIFKIIMCAGKAEVYIAIEKIINELCQIFTSEYFHIGGDEAPKNEWKNCPYCKEKLVKTGLENYESLQGYMLNYAADILKNNGKKVICWNDSLKASNLNKEIIVQYWQNKLKAKINSDRKLVFSNVFTLYFDYPYCVSNLKRVYNYSPKIKFKKVPNKNILGLEAALWTERISTAAQLEFMLFPRAIALAEICWGSNQNYKNFINRLSSYYIWLEKAKINAAPLQKAQVKGFARLWQLIKFSGTMLKAFICLILPQKVEF